ncbi:Cytochrome P450 family protein [Metarhizium album ARSEF 1941]|uniref:Cytochrome P450 family protein n=1 Tax=Metarhizium album (strain ARSEF 1941) TaxID=1081103 RepID=A0A0B2X6G2_METAS|nr:Cytochrome P450 family protein [Metarhizium album ARSEF 1941]KHO01328.1 Cytochrome P450 family protein [Metarhizium album ARSEF 1941]
MAIGTLLGLICALLVSLAVGQVIYALFLSPYRNVPGPRLCKITRYWAVYHDMWLQRIEKIYEWHRKYGDVVMVAPGEVSFSNAALTREIYGSTGRHPKSKYFDNFLMYGERPIFCTLDVREHRQMLKRTFAFYQPTTLYKPAMLEPLWTNVRRFLDQLKRDIAVNPTVDVLLHCNFYSFDNITNLVYGPKLCARTIGDAQCEERKILEGWKEVEVWNNLSYNFPLVHKMIRTAVSYARKDPTFLSAEERLTDWNMEKIESARRDPDKMVAGSLLHQLSNMKTPDGEPVPVSWIAAEMLDNIHAAQTTVALSLTYTLWNLACHPQWQGRIRAELLALPPKEDGRPSFDDIMAAPTLDACFRESSRLNPLSSGRAERVVPATKAYDGVVLPAGTVVSTSTLTIHQRSDIFSDAHAYRPERWLEADEATLRAMESCYMPFGYGARLCLGKAFAVAEIKLLIAGIVMEFGLWDDPQSATTHKSMEQLGTQNAMPRGRRCDLGFRLLTDWERSCGNCTLSSPC